MQKYNEDSDDIDAPFMIYCDGCGIWTHGICAGIKEDDPILEEPFYCIVCELKDKKVETPLSHQTSMARKGSVCVARYGPNSWRVWKRFAIKQPDGHLRMKWILLRLNVYLNRIRPTVAIYIENDRFRFAVDLVDVIKRFIRSHIEASDFGFEAWPLPLYTASSSLIDRIGFDRLFEFRHSHSRKRMSSDNSEKQQAVPTSSKRSAKQLKSKQGKDPTTEMEDIINMPEPNQKREILNDPKVSTCQRIIPYDRTLKDRKLLYYPEMPHASMDFKSPLFIAKSRIAGFGAFAKRAFPAGSKIIEYIGQLVGNALSDRREAMYSMMPRWKHDCYLFRVDEDTVIDATLVANEARFINHSCAPNCEARRISNHDGSKHIFIYALTDISPGQELTYDYKFSSDKPDDRVACYCGASNCRGWMN